MIDCFSLLNELQKAGLNNSEVARRLDVPRSSPEYWKAGGKPNADNYLRLVMLYCEVVRPTDAQILVTTKCYKLAAIPLP